MIQKSPTDVVGDFFVVKKNRLSDCRDGVVDVNGLEPLTLRTSSECSTS